MKFANRRAALVLCSVTMIAVSGEAWAKPVKKAAQRQAAQSAIQMTGEVDNRPQATSGISTPQAAPVASRRSRARTAAVKETTSAFGGFSSSTLVSEARKYLGTNPTGRASLWCGAFMDMVLKRTGHAGGGNLAKGYIKYGRRVSGPQVGAIAVMHRKGGGHVGVVSGVDANGNPIVVSGNHNDRVAETVYPAGRIIAYVVPN